MRLPADDDATAVFFPRTTPEHINAIAHYYRAEVTRMAGWRDRLDRTTNWAITAVAAMLSLTLSSATAQHGVLLAAMLLVTLLLAIEARRYRFYDVYRRRVRILEAEYFAPMFATQPAIGNHDWARQLSKSLREPYFGVSYSDALSRRLRRNYIWMYLLLLFAWMLKVFTAQRGQREQDFVNTWSDLISNTAIGPVSGWLTFAAVMLFYAFLLVIVALPNSAKREFPYAKVHM